MTRPEYLRPGQTSLFVARHGPLASCRAADNPFLYDKAVGQAFSPYLQDVEKSYSGFDRVAILDSKGIILSSSAPESIGQDLSDRGYVKAALKGETFLSQPLLSRVSGMGVMISATPVKRDGKIIGVLYCSSPLSDLDAKSVKPIKIGKEGHAYVLTAQDLWPSTPTMNGCSTIHCPACRF